MTARRAVLQLCAAAALVLAGCGGGGGGGRGPDGRRATKPASSPSAPRPAALTAWRFRADPRDGGLRGGWQRRPSLAMRTVAMPYVPDADAISGPAGARAYAGSVGWYRATATVPRDGRYAIRFGSANHGTTVWVDGRRICAHTGAYVPFTCIASLTAGRPHDLAVRVDWRSVAAAKAAGFDRAWFNYGGLDRPVSIAPAGAVELTGPRVHTVLRDGGRTAVVDVAVFVHDRGRAGTAARDVAVTGTLDTTTLRFAPVRVPGGGGRLAHARAVVRNPSLWSPAGPALTALRLTAPGAEPVAARVGLRELTWRGGVLRLNGRRLELKGATLPADARGHGDAFTGADDARIVGELEAIGANAARAQYPLDDALLARLDAAGILVWQEIGPFDPGGAWSSDTPALRARARSRALATVAREQAHPSIVAWSLANEASGQGHPGGQAAYIDGMAQTLHRIDPGRPVAADLWGRHLPKAAGLLHRHLDALGLTSYVGWYEELGAPRAQQDAILRGRVASLRALFPAKVLVFTEFGAAGNRANPAGSPGSESWQAARVGHQATVLGGLPALSGTLVFALRDYALHPGFDGGSAGRAHPELRFADALNEKGLFRFDGSPKPAAAAVRRAFGG